MLGALPMLWAVLATVPQDAPQAIPAQPVVSVEVRPQTVAVGEPFTVRVRVRAAAGVNVRFPAVPDSGQGIEAVDPRAIEDSSTSAVFDQSAVYRFTAWETGRREVPLGGVSWDLPRAGGGKGMMLQRLSAFVEVTSLLPADTSEHVPRSARDTIAPPPQWWRLGLAAAAVLAIVTMLWLAWRRRRRSARPADAFVDAQAAFDAIDQLALVDAGEPGRAVMANAEVMRDYLARRFPAASEGLTTAEFVRALADNDLPILPDEVSAVLDAADAVKFAAAPVDAEVVRQVARAARGVVRDVQVAYEARLAALDKGKGVKGHRHARPA